MSNDELHHRKSHTNGDGADAMDELLDRLTTTLRDMPISPGPDRQTFASTLSALRAADKSPQGRRPPLPRAQSGRIFSLKFAVRLALAACVVAAAGVALFTMPTRNNIAFANVLEQVKQASAIRCKVKTTRTIGKLPSINDAVVEGITMTIMGSRTRQDTPGHIMISDFEEGEMLMLDPRMKVGLRLTWRDVPAQKKSVNYMELLRAMKPDGAKDIGLQTFDGKKLRGFRYEGQGIVMTIWADPKIGTPVRIETTFSAPMLTSNVVMHSFEWDVPVETAQMSFEVPKDYTIIALRWPLLKQSKWTWWSKPTQVGDPQ